MATSEAIGVHDKVRKKERGRQKFNSKKATTLHNCSVILGLGGRANLPRECEYWF